MPATKLPRTRLAATVAERIIGGASPSKVSREVAALLLSENRVGELDSVLRDVQAAMARHGHVEVLASCAHPLTAAGRTDISATVKRLFPTAKKIIISEVYDPDVIGGVRLRLADRQLDLSARAKLNTFKRLTVAGKE